MAEYDIHDDQFGGMIAGADEDEEGETSRFGLGTRPNRLMFDVLLEIAEAPKHGYPILKQLRQLSGHYRDLGPSSLYRVINELAEEGLLAAREPEPGDRPGRRTLALTPKGEAVVRREIYQTRKDLQRALQKAHRIVELDSP